MGALLHDEPAFVKSWRARIIPLVMVLFLPIFFTYTGLRSNIGCLDSACALGWCGSIVFLATLGKFGGAYTSARMSGLSPMKSKILVIMAIFSTVVTSPLLRR